MKWIGNINWIARKLTCFSFTNWQYQGNWPIQLPLGALVMFPPFVLVHVSKIPSLKFSEIEQNTKNRVAFMLYSREWGSLVKRFHVERLESVPDGSLHTADLKNCSSGKYDQNYSTFFSIRPVLMCSSERTILTSLPLRVPGWL